ncbi:MAG TPA: hypothetical protein VJI75_06210 [Candidatus Nanoarchaeia archaeon]|nr:hypothetical protein [Candidatus Nanoarchaeia archaeon]
MRYIVLIIAVLMLVASCGTNETQVKYITGKSIYASPAPSAAQQPSKPAASIPEVNSSTLVKDSTVTIPKNISGQKAAPNSSVIPGVKTSSTGAKVYYGTEEHTPIESQERNQLNAMRCDDTQIILGYHSCYNLTSGNAVVTLKNQGQTEITGLWFNIEIDGKAHYESISQSLRFLQYGEFILPVPRWAKKYGSADRIIIIPEIYTRQGNKACPNCALLLVPSQSCNNLAAR